MNSCAIRRAGAGRFPVTISLHCSLQAGALSVSRAAGPRYRGSRIAMNLSTRREFLRSLGVGILAAPELRSAPPKKVAAVVTIYTHNSHADVIVSRILQGYDLLGEAPFPNLKLASLYVDQIAPKDIGQELARKHGVRLSESIADALTLGGGDLAVDGVLLIGEHGNYPTSDTGQIMYPRRRFFEETVAVLRRSGR